MDTRKGKSVDARKSLTSHDLPAAGGVSYTKANCAMEEHARQAGGAAFMVPSGSFAVWD